MVAGCTLVSERNDAHIVHAAAQVGQDRFAIVHGHNVHYVEAGSGQPVVLIPGAFSTYRVWSRVIPHLAERYRVIAIDYLGAGDSDKPEAGFDYSVSAQADVVAGLARALGLEAPILVGVSYGSSIALNVAARYRGLPSMVACIEGGVLIPTDLLDYSPCFGAFGIPVLGDTILGCMSSGLFDRICSRAIMGGAWDDLAPAEQDEIVAIQSSYLETATRVSTYRIYRSITSQIDFTAEMANVRTPILYLYGDSSKYRDVAEANLALFRRSALNVEMLELKGGIHDLQLQYPSIVANIMMRRWDAVCEVALVR